MTLSLNTLKPCKSKRDEKLTKKNYVKLIKRYYVSLLKLFEFFYGCGSVSARRSKKKHTERKRKNALDNLPSVYRVECAFCLLICNQAIFFVINIFS